jgi:hypothetical protein
MAKPKVRKAADSVSITVELPGGERVEVPTRFHHVSQPGLVDQEGDEFGAREHLFRISIDRLFALAAGQNPADPGEPALPMDRYEIARLTVVTYPVELAEGDGWLSVCFGSEESHFYDLVESVIAPKLWEGALIYAKSLDVRPSVRGQGLGLKLLRGGIRSVNEDVGDDNPVVLIARPWHSKYEPEEEDDWRSEGASRDDDPRWDEEIRSSHGLAQYYRRLGLRGWTQPDERTTMQVLYLMAASKLKRFW